MKRVVIAFLMIGLVSPALVSAAPTVINFEGRPDGEVVGANYLGTIVSFSQTDGRTIYVDPYSEGIPGPVFDGEQQARTDPFFGAGSFRADFDSSVDMVSVVLGDFNADYEDLFLSAYDAGDTFLNGYTDQLQANVFGGYTLTVASPGIKYVLFGSTGDYNNSVYFDVFTFDAGSTVPAPAALVLGSLGAGLVGWLRRRRTL